MAFRRSAVRARYPPLTKALRDNGLRRAFLLDRNGPLVSVLPLSYLRRKSGPIFPALGEVLKAGCAARCRQRYSVADRVASSTDPGGPAGG